MLEKIQSEKGPVKIVLLPKSLASRIAAGEVIQRPASVVKELVENALDAGAKEVSVWVEGGGVALIRVSDDGEGMGAEDLPLALERHATSKLRDEADLLRISTLGFRGEALPSIALVSKMTIVSRTRDEETGFRLQVEGGEKGQVLPAGCPVGTTVEVRDLFFDTRAKRGFLKSPETELSYLCDVIDHTALAFSEVHFRLYHMGRPLRDYPAAAQLRDRVEQIQGAEIAREMVACSWDSGEIKVAGLLSVAPSFFPNSRRCLTYVNRRFVRDRILTHAILAGYETLLMKGRYPAVALCLEVPFHKVDVNVHPAKYEVRFRRQSEVHDAVMEAVREGLRREAKAPTARTLREPEPAFLGIREGFLPYGAPSREEGLQFPSDGSGAPEAEGAEVNQGFFSSLEVLGQILGCYLVCVSARGLALIDQHAAHERIAFEKMRRQIERGEVERQNLLLPQIVEFPYPEAVLLERRRDAMERFGFTLEGFGPNTFAIKAAPALLPPGDYRGVIRRMVAELAEVGRSGEIRKDLEERLMTLACHSVVRAHQRLGREEIQALLNELDGIDFATQCPHGRPVFLEITQGQLERMFKRV